MSDLEGEGTTRREPGDGSRDNPLYGRFTRIVDGLLRLPEKPDVSYGCGAIRDHKERRECDHDRGWDIVNPFVGTAMSLGLAHRSVIWQGSIGVAYTHGAFQPIFRVGASFVWPGG